MTLTMDFTNSSAAAEEFAADGNKMRPFIHPEDLPYIEEMLQDPEQYDQTIHLENRVVCKDGAVKWISAKKHSFS